MNTLAETIKIKNIIDMSIGFASMSRVFEAGSLLKIADKLNHCIGELDRVNSKEALDQKRNEFCDWFIANIKTAEKKKHNIIIKPSKNTSWGQAAKVFNMILKVCVYYCNLPSNELSQKFIPWLDAAVDTKMMEALRKRYTDPLLAKVIAIEDVDNTKYKEIQMLLRLDINESFSGQILPVQWDDIMWRRLNKISE